MVILLDRPPIKTGRGDTVTSWYAIVPPADVVQYVRADGTHSATFAQNEVAERTVAYETTQDGTAAAERISPPDAGAGEVAKNPAENLPRDIEAEIAQVEAMRRAILSDQPIHEWNFETVRARYQAILKRAGANPVVEEAIRALLAQVTKHEQAADAARTIRKILARSHDRASQIAAADRRRSTLAEERPRVYSALGLVKPSAQMVDGHRLYSLIGNNGRTVAYLDVPPGLDIDSFVTRRVGVRGVSHYNEDLGARLITVRDVEAIEARR
jgi:hypothetical protein